MSTILKEIQSHYPLFTEKERMIANYLLSHPQEASNSHIQEMANKTGVSVASITRFAKKVSCNSFVELKVKLAAETGRNESSLDLKEQYINILHEVHQLVDFEELDHVLSRIEAAERIYIYGLGSSGLAAQELNYRLSRMGFFSEAVTDPHLMIIKSSLLTKSDLILSFSRTGQTKDLITAVERAKLHEAVTISFTTNGNTPLTNLSDHVLWTIHPIKTHYLSTGLDISALYIIDMLSTRLLQKQERKDIYEKTVEAISKRFEHE